MRLFHHAERRLAADAPISLYADRAVDAVEEITPTDTRRFGQGGGDDRAGQVERSPMSSSGC